MTDKMDEWNWEREMLSWALRLQAVEESLSSVSQTMGAMINEIEDLERRLAEEREACAAIADVYAGTKPDIEASTNPELARLIATIVSDTGSKIAEQIRARNEHDRKSVEESAEGSGGQGPGTGDPAP